MTLNEMKVEIVHMNDWFKREIIKKEEMNQEIYRLIEKIDDCIVYRM
ncbi:hypothetical protein [Lederbergia citri]|uniref:Uncharacterized protein n=1 Tax=Lederbergia citri TaxID=2833580 RepID=A0A942TED3_9BACI|nr:hypothetical protein [Lederbergia citri]MBS4194669.1 hypothetical protein [Lederbergia citri]